MYTKWLSIWKDSLTAFAGTKAFDIIYVGDSANGDGNSMWHREQKGDGVLWCVLAIRISKA